LWLAFGFLSKESAASTSMGTLPQDHEQSALRDIYSLIDTMLVEQEGSGVGTSSPMSKLRSTSRRMLPSSTCSMAETSSVYTTGTALCIFDDDTVDTFCNTNTKRNAWPKPPQLSIDATPLSHTVSEHSRLSQESFCPWEANWAELTLRSEASVVEPLDKTPLPLPLSSSWSVPSLHHRPPPHRPEANDADVHGEMPTSLHHYFTWKPMYHKAEV
jgi:hypothetical protein